MPDEIVSALHRLRDCYTEAVNAAIAEDRDDLVAELAASYPDAELRLLTSFPAPGVTR